MDLKTETKPDPRQLLAKADADAKAEAKAKPKPRPEPLDEQPNIRLSRAFYVVMLLHIVAVGGVVAFNIVHEKKVTPVITEEDRKLADPNHQPAPLIGLAPAPGVPTLAQIKKYTVLPGDTLESIAQKNNLTVQDLARANSISLTARPASGTDLILPEPIPAPTAATPTAATPVNPTPVNPGPPPVNPADPALAKVPAPPGQPQVLPAQPLNPNDTRLPGLSDDGRTYTVQKNDTIAKIARSLKTNQKTLMDLNKITNPNKLQLGQKLQVPAP